MGRLARSTAFAALSCLASCAASRHVGTRIHEGGTDDAAPRPHAAVVSEHGGVRRTRSRDGDHLLLRTMVTIDGWRIGLVGSPDVRTERVGMTVSGPHLARLFDERCELRVMVDGVLLGVLDQERFQPRRGSRPAMLAVRLPLLRLVAMAAGDRVAMRVCGEEIRLEREHRAVLAEFLLQYDEEHRWADPVEPQDLTPVADPSSPAPTTAPDPSIVDPARD